MDKEMKDKIAYLLHNLVDHISNGTLTHIINQEIMHDKIYDLLESDNHK